MQSLDILVEWRQGPISFSLQTTDETVARRAGQIFSCWNMPSEHTARSLLMVVAHHRSGYELTCSTGERMVMRDIESLMRALETSSALFLLDQTDLILTAHGALLERNGRGILIVGPSHSGKSTTSCALWAAGWRLLSDDVTIIEPGAGTAEPMLRRVSLRHPSRDLLGDDFWERMTNAVSCDPTPEGYIFHPDELDGSARAGRVPLVAIVFLNRQGAIPPPPAALAPVHPASGLMSLCPYTNVVRKDGMGEAMRRLAGIIPSVPIYDMGRGPLPDMVATLNQLVGVNA